MFEILSSHISPQVLFSTNLCLCLLVGLYRMETRSSNALIYFMGYGIGMCVISIIQISGYIDLAFKLSALAAINFVCAFMFVIVRLFRANLKKRKEIAN